MFWQLVGNGLVTGSVIAIAAVGVSLVYGILRLVNFAYGDVMAFGAFVAYLFDVTVGLPMVVATLLAMMVTAALSVALEGVLWRPLRAQTAPAWWRSDRHARAVRRPGRAWRSVAGAVPSSRC